MLWTIGVIAWAFVLSKRDCCHSLLSVCPDYIVSTLQKVQNSAAKLDLKAGKSNHVQRFVQCLHWLLFQRRIECGCLWSVVRKRELAKCFTFNIEVRGIRVSVEERRTWGGCSSVGKVSDWNARRNTDAGSSPGRGTGFFSQIQVYGVRTAPVCSGIHHLCARHKWLTQAAIPLFGHTVTRHTLIGMGSAALAAFCFTR